jgi:ribosomal protein S18 acetylase RimI-like enzyme
MPRSVAWSFRPYAARDEEALLDLIAADQLPGQPRTTPAMLREALAGRSWVDAGWWAELDPPLTDVLCDSLGGIAGVVSYARRPHDKAGLILWLHCREDPARAQSLVDHVVNALGTSTVHAFDFASALSLGLEALPVGHRPATRAALEAAGFTGRRLWRYMRAALPLTALPRAGQVTVGESDDPQGRRLEVRDGRRVVAEATVGRPVEGIGVLWWIGVEPGARGQGLGTALLGSATDVLADLGATEVILFVDDDAPPGDPERDRSAANRMYDRAGMTEVDRLYSFTRP